MLTCWGDIEAGDAHVHFFSHRFFSMLAGQRSGDASARTVEAAGAALGWEMPPPEPELLAGRWRAELDRHGVARAALIASVPGDENSVAAAVAAFPDRFYGYFMVNPCAAGAVERARKALDEDKLQGICLFPAMHGYPVQDERVQPLIELAAARPGAIVFVHCGVLTVGARKKLGLPSPFDLKFSNPADLHAVALRHPQVNFVIPHFGAGYLREALMVCDLCPNVHLDTSSSNSWLRYLDSGIDLRRVFQRALDVAGARRLLFGTDSSFFPRGWQAAIFEQQAGILRALGAGEEEARAIFGGNLDRLLARDPKKS